MLDTSTQYEDAVEQTAVNSPQFDYHMHVSIYRGDGSHMIDGVIVAREYKRIHNGYATFSYIYDVWGDDCHWYYVPEHRLDRIVRSEISRNHLTAIKGGVK